MKCRYTLAKNINILVNWKYLKNFLTISLKKMGLGSLKREKLITYMYTTSQPVKVSRDGVFLRLMYPKFLLIVHF